jgi:hypothetical protein
VKLHAVHKKEPTKEFVGREGEAMIEKGEEHHPEALI